MKLLDEFRRGWRCRLHERMDNTAMEAARADDLKARIKKAVTKVLGTSSMPGCELRAKLWCPPNMRLGLVRFYYWMAQLEDAGVIEGWYQTEVIDGQSVRQRWYRVATTQEQQHDRASA